MKKFYLIAAIMLLVSVSINSTNVITMGDTIRINPNKLDGYSRHAVTMHNDGYADSWMIAVTYPEGLFPKLVAGVAPLDGMTVPYVDRNGNDQVYTCPLNVSAAYANIGSAITAMGYWDYNFDGEFESYGTVKWSAGSHAMFEFNLYVDKSFRSGYITFDGTISSGYDQRGAVLQGVRFFSRTWCFVGYERGDVSGNGRIDIGDVPLLIDYLLTGEGLDEFQLSAADVDLDGDVSISDVSTLVDMLVND